MYRVQLDNVTSFPIQPQTPSSDTYRWRFSEGHCFVTLISGGIVVVPGGSPYPRMDGRKIANLLQDGYRMPKPQHVDEKVVSFFVTSFSLIVQGNVL